MARARPRGAVRRTSPATTVRLLAQAAGALDAAHAAGLVHRDVKPANLLLTEAPDGGVHVYVADGIARVTGAATLTRTGLVGTPGFLSPEAVQGRPAGPASDQHALACVAVECLTGVAAFAGASEFAVVRAHVDGPRPQPAAACGLAAVDVVLARALAVDPEQRYPSCRAFAAAFTAAVEARPLPAPAVAGAACWRRA